MHQFHGICLADYFDKHVFGPLAMHDTSLVWKDAFATRARRGTSMFETVRQVRFLKPVAAASLYTTASDYARFMSALLNDDRGMALAVPIAYATLPAEHNAFRVSMVG
ncbi:MAG: serine hydrolase [Burkholderiales bacterium]